MKISMSLQMSNLEIDGEKYKIEKTGEKRAASSNYIVHTREGDTNSNHREKQVYVSDLPKEVVIPDPVIKTQNHPQTPRAHTPRPGRILYIHISGSGSYRIPNWQNWQVATGPPIYHHNFT